MDSERLDWIIEIPSDPVVDRALERVRRGERINPEDDPHPEGFDSEQEREDFLVWLYGRRQRNEM